MTENINRPREIDTPERSTRWYSSRTGLGASAALLAVVILFVYFVIL